MTVTNAQLSAQLVDVLKEVQAIRQENAAREERERQIKKTVDDHEAVLNGNGKVGLKTQVALLEQAVSKLTILLGVIGGPLLASTIGIIVLILTHQLPGFNP